MQTDTPPLPILEKGEEVTRAIESVVSTTLTDLPEINRFYIGIICAGVAIACLVIIKRFENKS